MKKLIFALAIIATMTGCRFGEPKPTYSDGYRMGRVEKFSNKGFFYKTWEGRMILQGYDRDDKGNMVVRTFQFSLADPGIAPAIEAAMVSGQPVKLHYRQDWMEQWRYSSSYFVDAVEVTK